jgi:surfactin synthase thioesterase subunit
MKHRYAIIGHSVAAVAAVEAIRSIDKEDVLQLRRFLLIC